MLLADGRRQIMRFVFPNDILDWAEAATMPFSAEAVEHAEVRCFSRTRLEGVLSRNAAARENWKRLAEQHFHEMQRHSVVLGRLSSIERLAYFLIWLRQHADDSSDGDIHLPMARGDIADYLGVTVETVSRGFTILRDAGMIDLVNSRHIRLKKPRALSKLAGNILAVGEVDGTASTGATDGYCQAS
jgi:CRP-like cAMP-binding protein